MSEGSRGRDSSGSASSAVSKKPPSPAANCDSATSSRVPRGPQPGRVAGGRQQGQRSRTRRRRSPPAPRRAGRRRRRGRPGAGAVRRGAGRRAAGRVDRRVDVPRLAQQHARLGEGRDRQPVPGGDHLVVAGRAHPVRPGREQPAAHRLPAVRVVGLGEQLQRGLPVLERAGLGDLEQRGRPGAVVGAEHLDQLGRRPDVEPALDALGVGVQRRGEPALVGAQLGQQEVGGLPGHPLAQRVAGLPPPARVDAEQLGVVVEHLLEVRHHPAVVDRVAREPAGELVVQAAAGHRAQRAGRPSPTRSGRRSARRAGAGTPAPSRAGTSGRCRSRRSRRRSRRPGSGRRRPAGPRRAGPPPTGRPPGAGARTRPRPRWRPPRGGSSRPSESAPSTCRNAGWPCRGWSGK